MPSVLIKNIGGMVSGDIQKPLLQADSLYVEDGRIAGIGSGPSQADSVIDARGNLVAPGLIDGHVHPSIGDFTPVQNATNWISNYLQGGVTSMVSAGELHLPGLPIDKPDPEIFRSLALLTRSCYQNYRPARVKVEAGTLLLVPGLQEKDFQRLAAAGSRLVKFIFYPYGDNPEEEENYGLWARKHGFKIKIHSGGVSRSGVSRPADAETILRINPDIAGHINGGPIPPADEDVRRIVSGSEIFLEIAYCGNARVAQQTIAWARDAGCLQRIVLGTDTPSGTGVTPRGMLRVMALAAAVEGIRPEQALCMATGSVARAHGLESGRIEEGRPADILILGRIQGASGKDALASLQEGNLLGISMALIDGELVIRGRSLQTPPPETAACFR